MLYKTIILELLQQRPELHEQLRMSRDLLAVMGHCARALKASHEACKEKLSRRQGIDPGQIESMAMEIALQEMEQHLRLAFPPNEQKPLSLDSGIAFIRNLTSHG